jgi:integrase
LLFELKYRIFTYKFGIHKINQQMKNSVNTLFYIRNSRKNEKGEAPIYLRLTIAGKRIDLSTSRFVQPSKWSAKTNQMKGNSEDARVINNYLIALKTKILKFINNLELQEKEPTLQNIKDLLSDVPKSNHRLLEFFHYHNKRIHGLIGKDYAAATYNKYVYTKNKVASFIKFAYKKTDIDLIELNHAFVSSFDYYLKTEEKISNNTAMKYIKNLKKVINEAVRLEFLDKDPFTSFKIKLDETNRTFLDQTELDAIISKPILIQRLSEVRDLFVFACYTGFAFADIEKLTPLDITIGIDGEKWIITNRKKTDTRSPIPLLSPALNIIEKYRNDHVCNAKGKLLPSISNQKTNAYLKEIAAICGINKNLTFHMARHTFATTVTLTNGVPIETLSKMMGHTSIKTTQIYGKVIDRKISNDMSALKAILEPKVKLQEQAI